MPCKLPQTAWRVTFLHVTWSIVAVDSQTHEVGVGAATCTVGVEMVRGIVPGVGVIAAQASTNLYSRNEALKALASGSSLEEAFAAAEAVAGERGLPDWSAQQFAGAVLGDSPRALAHTGSGTVTWAGSRQAGSVSVQGNMIRGPEVLDQALSAFLADDGAPDLAERILRSLEAGADAGGDKRCPIQCPAMTAFVAVAAPDEQNAEEPALFLVAPRSYSVQQAVDPSQQPRLPTPGDKSPVTLLRDMFDKRR